MHISYYITLQQIPLSSHTIYYTTTIHYHIITHITHTYYTHHTHTSHTSHSHSAITLHNNQSHIKHMSLHTARLVLTCQPCNGKSILDARPWKKDLSQTIHMRCRQIVKLKWRQHFKFYNVRSHATLNHSLFYLTHTAYPRSAYPRCPYRTYLGKEWIHLACDFLKPKEGKKKKKNVSKRLRMIIT